MLPIMKGFNILAIFLLLKPIQNGQAGFISDLINSREVEQTTVNPFLWSGASNQEEHDKAEELPPDLSTVDLITRRGYPVETHDIVTGDGYILTTFRIPYGKSSHVGYPQNYNRHVHKKYPVYIMHGGAMSSSDWLVNLSEKNILPFLLADAGYDVWLGNFRGNIYSNKHVELNHEQTKYWNFSFDETAEFDVPDAIDYILDKTKMPKLHYIGYSLGNTQFFMAMARNPEYNHKIALHVSYSVSVFWSENPDTHKLSSKLTTRPLEILQRLIGGFPVPPQGITFLLNKLLSRICSPKLDLLGLCRQVLFLIMGFGPEQISRAQTPSLLGHLLTPTSLKMLIHSQQLTNSDRLCYYDYGKRRNEELYGQAEPPLYDIRLITAPVSLILGENDRFGNIRQINRLFKALPNIVDFYTIPFKNFTHIDFVYGSNAGNLLYNHTINIMNKFSYF